MLVSRIIERHLYKPVVPIYVASFFRFEAVHLPNPTFNDSSNWLAPRSSCQNLYIVDEWFVRRVRVGGDSLWGRVGQKVESTIGLGGGGE